MSSVCLTVYSAIESRILDGRAISGTQTVPVSSLHSSLPEKTLEDIKVRACAIPSKDSAPLPTINYPLTPGTTLLLDSHVRQSPADVLLGGDEEDTVAALILKSRAACSVDARKGQASRDMTGCLQSDLPMIALCENIVLLGGTSEIRGFKARLIAELQSLAAQPEFSEFGQNVIFCLVVVHIDQRRARTC